MRSLIHRLFTGFLLFLSIYSAVAFAGTAASVPILVYHNFNPTVPGSMSITPKKFEMQLQWLKENGFTVIPLKELVSYLQGATTVLPAKPVVITADDGWESVYVYMVPLARKYHIPVTLFIYPSTISHGLHAMTWGQLQEIQKTEQFDIQGHTYWHPNFTQEQRRLTPEEYDKFVHVQLYNSKKILEDKLGKKITLLVWPYGIYNDYLERVATKAGYGMAFSIDDRHTSRSEKIMAQPRFMIVAGQSIKSFAAMMNWQAQGKKNKVR